MLNVCFVVGLLAGGLAGVPGVGFTCDRVACAPVLQKCVKSRWCECTPTNFSCCKECFGSVFTECCGCVDTCPMQNETTKALDTELDIDSYVGELDYPVIPLFDRYVSSGTNMVPLIFPVKFDVEKISPQLLQQLKQLKLFSQINSAQEVSSKKNMVTLNCSVIYMNDCLPWNRCQEVCSKVGAVSYRWFFDGCCECVGDYCKNFGLNQSRCMQCPNGSIVPTLSADTGYEEDTIGRSYLYLNYP